MTNNIAGIIFDLDGTIFDSEKVWKDAAIEMNKKFNINIDDQFRLECCGRGENETILALHKKFPNIDAAEVRKEWGDLVRDTISMNGVKFKKGFKSLINYLIKNKVKIGLATGSKYECIEKYFQNTGFNPKKIFDAILTIENVKKGKPNPEIYKKAMKKLNVKPKQCIVIEDSPNGAQAAWRCGAKVLLVPDVFPPTKQALRKCVTLKDLNEVKKYLQEFIQN